MSIFTRSPVRGLACSLAVSISLSPLPVAASSIELSNPFNFREVRTNAPLDFQDNTDVLIFGGDIADSMTQQIPDNAVVTARNSNDPNRVVSLSRFSATGYSAGVPYSPELANGSWSVTVESSSGAASFNLPTFGTGPGTGPLPSVDNLNVTGSGANRTMNWTLPANLETANDGNVDRLRVRLYDSNYQLLHDQRLPTGTSLTETSYALPADQIKHNGVYNAEVLVEGFTPFERSRTFSLFRVEDVGTGGRQIAENEIGAYNFRDVRGPNSVNFGEGDFISSGIVLPNDPSILSTTFADAQQNGSVFFLDQTNDRPTEFSGTRLYNASLLGDVDITVYNGEHKTTKSVRGIGDVEALGTVRNVMLQPNGLTPTLTWQLPVGVDFDLVQIGLFDDVTNSRIPIGENGSLFRNLPQNATSFTFDEGLLNESGKYVARVILNQLDDQNATLSRSISFLNFTPAMNATGNVVLPSIDSGGVFHFDVDVEAETPVLLDPFVAVGYIFETGAGDPNFLSVKLPTIAGDDSFIVRFSNGSDIIEQILMAGVQFLFPVLGGVDMFTILGIDPAAGIDPSDVTAFVTEVTFAAAGQFTGSMTPITVFVVDATVPEPSAASLLVVAFVLLAVQRRGATTRQ